MYRKLSSKEESMRVVPGSEPPDCTDKSSVFTCWKQKQRHLTTQKIVISLTLLLPVLTFYFVNKVWLQIGVHVCLTTVRLINSKFLFCDPLIDQPQFHNLHVHFSNPKIITLIKLILLCCIYLTSFSHAISRPF